MPVTDSVRDGYWRQHRERISDLSAWQFKGRIAVQAGKEAWSGSLHWRQDREAYQLRLIAPLGQGTYELTGDEQGVSMRTAENQLLYADDPAVLLRENLGWEFPLSGLAYWVKGIPEPGVETDLIQLDDKGRITGLSQSGWRIKYFRYANRSGYELPGKISLENGGIKVRLLIRDWSTAL